MTTRKATRNKVRFDRLHSFKHLAGSKGIYRFTYVFWGWELPPAINVLLTLRLLGIRAKDYLTKVLFQPILITLIAGLKNILVIQAGFQYWQTPLINYTFGCVIFLVAAFDWVQDLFGRGSA